MFACERATNFDVFNPVLRGVNGWPLHAKAPYGSEVEDGVGCVDAKMQNYRCGRVLDALKKHECSDSGFFVLGCECKRRNLANEAFRVVLRQSCAALGFPQSNLVKLLHG